MARGVVHIQWYATVFRGDFFADAVSEWAAPTTLEYGATRYTVQRSLDDQYKILQQIWFESKDDWYRYWEGPEMIEFRARYTSKYQIPIVYVWHEEIAAGGAPVETVTQADLDAEQETSAA
jgi:hypothetical protein